MLRQGNQRFFQLRDHHWRLGAQHLLYERDLFVMLRWCWGAGIDPVSLTDAVFPPAHTSQLPHTLHVMHHTIKTKTSTSPELFARLDVPGGHDETLVIVGAARLQRRRPVDRKQRAGKPLTCAIWLEFGLVRAVELGSPGDVPSVFRIIERRARVVTTCRGVSSSR